MSQLHFYSEYQGLSFLQKKEQLERKYANRLLELGFLFRQAREQNKHFETIQEYIHRINELTTSIRKYRPIPFHLKYAKQIADIGIKTMRYGDRFPTINMRQHNMENLIKINNAEYYMDFSSRAQCNIHLIKMHNLNCDKLFKHDGMQYTVDFPTGSETTYIKYTYLGVLDTLAHLKKINEMIELLTYANASEEYDMNLELKYNTIEDTKIYNGIKECELFIENMFKHQAYHRKKMIGMLPWLLGHGIDANVATIIYDYCY